MKKLYKIELDEPSRVRLNKMLSRGVWAARKLKRARILLLAARADDQPELSDEQIAEKVGCGRNTVQRVRQRFATLGLEAALEDRERSGPSRRLLNTKAEQQVVALACTTPPNGAERWTLELLVQAVKNHKIASSISDETIRQILLRHALKPWLKKNVVHSKTK